MHFDVTIPGWVVPFVAGVAVGAVGGAVVALWAFLKPIGDALGRHL